MNTDNRIGIQERHLCQSILFKRKLRNEVLPYIATGRRLHKQWFCITYLLFGYTTDVLVALTALGIVSPILSGIFATNQGGDTSKTTSFADLTTALPRQLYYPVVLLVLAWIILRVAFNREEG